MLSSHRSSMAENLNIQVKEHNIDENARELKDLEKFAYEKVRHPSPLSNLARQMSRFLRTDN